MPFRQIKYLIITIFLSFISFGNIIAQVSYGGKPLPYEKKKADTKAVTMPLFDYNWVLQEMSSTAVLDGKKPFPVGWNYQVNLNPYNSGYWKSVSNEMKIWRLEIHSQNAFAISIFFDKFYLKEGARIFLYDPEQKEIRGSYDHRSNKVSGNFPVSLIPGDRVIIELQVPDSVSDFGQLNIGTVTHTYVNIFKSDIKKDYRFGTSESCNEDINCPAGDKWQDVKRSVCRIIFSSGSFSVMCSGALINNTAVDGIPYLLTANHCIDKEEEAFSAIFYFEYESPECNGPDGSINKTIAGSVIKATSDSLDFSLLLLAEDIPESYNPYFAGWTISPTPASSSVCIHHPNGDVKKISTYNNPVTSEYQPVNPPGWLASSTANGFWRVVEWDSGATQGGSSGAPLLNNSGLIVGNLTGGDATCTNPKNDYFSKFHMCWEYYPQPTRQLKPWLDKIGTGSTAIPGFDPNYAPDTASTIMDILTHSTDHKILSAALVASGLSRTLSGTDLYTVFAPTDEAFNKLIPGTLELILSDYDGKLTDILKNHIVADRIKTSSFYPGLILKSLLDTDISITVNNSGILYDYAPLSVVDIHAANGLVNFIDEVVLPLERKEDSFIIFPNPVIGDLWIITNKNTMKGDRLKLFNITGMLIAEHVIENEKLEKINLSNMSSGLYLLQITSDKQKFTKKLLLARPNN